MTRKPALMLAAALAVGAVGWSPAASFGQDATKQERKQQKQQEKEARQAEKDRRKEEKREKALLNKMPAPARDALTAQTSGGTEVDYYRLAGQDRVFGAMFRDETGQLVDVRVDRDGQIISRLTSDHPSETAEAAPAAADPAAAEITAEVEAPEVGVLLNSDQLPQPVRETMFKEIEGSPDPRYYRVMLGDQSVYETRYTTPDGKAMIAHVDETGRFIQRQEITPETPPAPTSTSSTDREVIDFDTMPKEIRDAMRKATKGGDGAQFYRATFNGERIFETRFWNDDDRRILVRMSEDGKILETKQLDDKRKSRDRDEDDRK